MMTRSDFVALSNALRTFNPESENPGMRLGRNARDSEDMICYGQWRIDCTAVADAIASKTPPHIFDRARFLRDCGIAQE